MGSHGISKERERKAIKESRWNGGLCNKGRCEVLLLLLLHCRRAESDITSALQAFLKSHCPRSTGGSPPLLAPVILHFPCRVNVS
jgi:hypothetical protein